MKKCSSKPTSS